MNPETNLESETIRSDINTTRERMDGTLDALGNRLEGRHLVDELLGFFRGRSGDVNRVRDQISQSAGKAVTSVVDTVKAHPLPVLVAGAGIAWLIYEANSSKNDDAPDEDWYTDRERSYGVGTYSDEAVYEETREGDSSVGEDLKDKASGMVSRASDKLGQVKDQASDKLSQVGDRAREKLNQVKDRSREALQSARDKMGEIGGQVQQRSREIYDKTRQQVSETTDQYPLQVGLGCLAVGLLIGLAAPTPEVVNRRVGPTVDKLKDRARSAGSEAVEKGKRVVQAAANALRDEAQKQGLTPEKLRESAGAVANRTTEAAQGAAKQEGIAMGQGASCDVPARSGGTGPT